MNITNQKSKFDAMKEMQLKGKMMAELFEEAMDINYMPAERITPRWKDAVVKAAEVVCPISVQLPIERMPKVLQCIETGFEKVSVFQFGILTNMLDAVSPNQLGMSLIGYTDFITELKDSLTFLKSLTGKVREALEIQVEKDLAAKRAEKASEIKDVDNSKEAPLKPIIGQA